MTGQPSITSASDQTPVVWFRPAMSGTSPGGGASSRPPPALMATRWRLASTMHAPMLTAPVLGMELLVEIWMQGRTYHMHSTVITR